MLAILIWVLMVLVCLMMPGIMMLCASDFLRSGDKTNKFYGYRTKMSMKNKETWKFAHTFCGNLWKRWGKIMLKSTLIAMALLLAFAIISISAIDSGTAVTVVAITGIAIMLIQLLVLIGSIIPVEKALNKEFDKEGNRRA